MNTDQLLDAMADSDPSPSAVLDLVRRKRRAARNRVISATAGGLAVVVAVVAGVVVHGLGPGAQSSSSAASGAYSGPVSGQAAPAASGLSSGERSPANGPAGIVGPAAETGACTQAVLAQLLARAVRSGASVIVASASLAASPAGHSAGSGSATYYPVTLRSVRTLAGHAVAPGAVAWITGSSSSASGAGAAPPMLAPGGQVFGVVYPPGSSGLPGPVLLAAAVVRGQVFLSSTGCWDTAAFPATLPQGIAVTPSLASPGHPASTEISLAVAERLAAGA